MSLQELVSIREFQPQDLNFILSSSIKCLLQYTSTLFKGWNPSTLAKFLEKKLLAGLNHPNFGILVACDAKDSNSILGYLVADSKSNHIFMQYTKYSYRKLGIQKLMLMPLLVDESEPITIEWGTKEIVKLHKVNKVSVINYSWSEYL